MLQLIIAPARAVAASTETPLKITTIALVVLCLLLQKLRFPMRKIYEDKKFSLYSLLRNVATMAETYIVVSLGMFCFSYVVAASK